MGGWLGHLQLHVNFAALQLSWSSRLAGTKSASYRFVSEGCTADFDLLPSVVRSNFKMDQYFSKNSYLDSQGIPFMNAYTNGHKDVVLNIYWGSIDMIWMPDKLLFWNAKIRIFSVFRTTVRVLVCANVSNWLEIRIDKDIKQTAEARCLRYLSEFSKWPSMDPMDCSLEKSTFWTFELFEVLRLVIDEF